jgi:hypothetical protein
MRDTIPAGVLATVQGPKFGMMATRIVHFRGQIRQFLFKVNGKLKIFQQLISHIFVRDLWL